MFFMSGTIHTDRKRFLCEFAEVGLLVLGVKGLWLAKE